MLLEPLIVGGGEGHVVPGGIHQALQRILIEDILLVLKCCHVKYMEICTLMFNCNQLTISAKVPHPGSVPPCCQIKS